MQKSETLSSGGSAYFEQFQRGRQLLVDQILKDSQLKIEDLSRFECRFLSQVKGWETDELEGGILGDINLISDGMVHIPVLAIVPKNSGAARDGLANLRMQFEYWGGDGGIPRFSAGFVVGDVEQHLASTSSFDFYIPYIDNPNRCIGFRWEPTRDAHMYGRNPSTAFHVKLPTNWQALFDENGLLRDESNLKTVASFLDRRVDLSPDRLDRKSHEDFSYWCGALSNRRMGYGNFKAVKNTFGISEGQSQQWKLNGDIPVEVTLHRNVNKFSILDITIKDIQIYPSDTTGHIRQLAHLVRPKENSSKGDLVITVVEDNSWYSVVTRNGEVDPTIKPVGFTNIDTLAVLLAMLH